VSTARRIGVAALILAGSVGGVFPLHAQDTTRAPADTAARARPPQARADTAAPADTGRAKPDTAARTDTVPAVRLTAPRPETPRGPLAPGERFVFTRDSLLWTSGYSLGDLLAEIPGAYVARAGFIDLPEPVVYGNRAADQIRIFWDGVPMVPVGPDSLAIDPGRISLLPLERVDVVRTAGGLDVYLVSQRLNDPGARTDVRILSGTSKTGGYGGVFVNRWPSGIEVAAAADYLGTNGFEGTAQAQRNDRRFDIWAKADWSPTPFTSASYQIRRHDYRRDPVSQGTILIAPQDGTRSDAIFRLSASSKPWEMGWHTAFTLASSKWSDTAQTLHTARQASLAFGYQSPNLSGTLTGRLGDTYETARAEAAFAWMPLRGIVLNAGGATGRALGGRTTRAAHGTVSLALGPFGVVGDAAYRRALAVPWFPADTVQDGTDVSARFRFTTRVLSGEVGLEQRDAYTPHALESYAVGIPSLGSPPRTTYLVASGAFTPIRPLTIDGWYSSPRTGTGTAFQPPRLMRVRLTFRSKFWPTFRSGAFDLKAQLALDAWSGGMAGVDSAGTAIPLPKANIYEFFLQFEIARFRAFYDLRNAFNANAGYVPGLAYPNIIQTFGVKWTFLN